MPHIRIAALAFLSLLTLSLTSCQSSAHLPGAAAAAAAPPPSTPDAVRGTIRLRGGTTFPPNASLHIVARCYGTKVGEQSLHPTGNWPVTFAVPLEWPRGKDNILSGGLSVYAMAEFDGRVLMVTDEKFADPPHDPTLVAYGTERQGAPVELTLIPTVE